MSSGRSRRLGSHLGHAAAARGDQTSTMAVAAILRNGHLEKQRAGSGVAGPARLGRYFLLALMSQVMVTGASSEPSAFCGLYSYLILA